MDALYRRYVMSMSRIVRHYIGNKEDIEDILHDGFIIIFTRIESVRDPERLEYWMGSSMKNLSLRHLAARDFDSLLGDSVEDTRDAGLQDLLSIEELNVIINKLPEGYQKVFRLAVFEGKSHKEIGEILGIAPNSSSSQLARAKAMVRKLIEERRVAGLLGLILIIVSAVVLYRSFGVVEDTAENRNIYVDNGPNSVERVPDGNILPSQQIASAEKVGNSASINRKRSNVQINGNSSPSITNEEMLSTNPIEVGDSNFVDVEQPEFRNRDVAEATEQNLDSVGKSEGLLHCILDNERYLADTDYTPHELKICEDSSNWSFGGNVGVGLGKTSGVHDLGYADGNVPAPDDPDDNTSDDDNLSLPVSIHDKVKNKTPNSNREVQADYPITVSLEAGYQLSRNLMVAMGVSYTYQRSKVAYSNSLGRVRDDIKSHSMGLSLKLNYNIFRYKKLNLYGAVTGQMDFPVTNKVASYVGSQRIPAAYYTFKTQWSVGVGLGFEYNITQKMGVFMEPSYRYNFDNGNTAPMYLHENNSVFLLPFGFRFHF